ncbi:hypothetical protein FACS1894159_02730 [Bacteroidia bacterium]|nr:hypothetical protein FACS1894159_02730 [Bacteroidia bacterium]
MTGRGTVTRLAWQLFAAGVALTPACAKTATPTPDSQSAGYPGPVVPGKYHPGHYICVADASVRLSAVEGYALEAVAGMVRRYNWRDLEPSKGHYDLSSIERDLKVCASNGKMLLAQIYDKSFVRGRSVCPAYLDGIMVEHAAGMIPARWTAQFVERYVAMVEAIAARFDAEPFFEGIIVQESGLGMNAPELSRLGGEVAYSSGQYAAALGQYLSGAAQALSRSRTVWFINWLEGGVAVPDSLICKLIPLQVVVAGPDILPYRANLVEKVYPKFDTFRGQLPLGNSMQADSYHTNSHDTGLNYGRGHSSEGGFDSMESLFLYGRDRLHLNYIFWSYPARPPGPDENTFADALAVIRKYPVFNR